MEYTGIDPLSELKLTASDASQADRFGAAVAGGDFDNDGYSDVAVGANGEDEGGLGAGAVYVFYGTATGIDVLSEQKIIASDAANDIDNFGFAIAVADVNNDGYADLVVGSQDGDGVVATAGAAYVYYGGIDGIDVASELKIVASDGESLDSFGEAVAAAGDVDGDGFEDLIIGAPDESDIGLDKAGAAYIYYGSATGISTTREDKLTASVREAFDFYGIRVSTAGDVNEMGLMMSWWGPTGTRKAALPLARPMCTGAPTRAWMRRPS